MVLIGLLLVVLSAALAVGVVASNTAHVTAKAFGVSLTHVSVGGLFLLGVVTALVFALGLAVLVAGMGRARRRRVERRRAVRESRDNEMALRAEKERLEGELADERRRRMHTGTTQAGTTQAGTAYQGESDTARDYPAQPDRPAVLDPADSPDTVALDEHAGEPAPGAIRS